MTTDELAELDPIAVLKADLQELAVRKQRHKVEEDAIEAESLRLVTALLTLGETEMITDLYTSKIQTNSQSRISAEILIARGVDPDIVKAATKSTTSKPFLRFYPRGE